MHVHRERYYGSRCLTVTEVFSTFLQICFRFCQFCVAFKIFLRLVCKFLTARDFPVFSASA